MDSFNDSPTQSKKFIRKVENKQYRVVNKIGEGAFGLIFCALDLKTNEQLAIKVVEIKNKSRRKIIEKEVKVLSLFEGDSNFVQIKNYFSFSIRTSSLYKKQKFSVIVMEKMEIDLMDYILAKGKISEAKSKYLFFHICKAVQTCHSQGLAHLDLKPDNVLLRFTKEDPKLNLNGDFESLFNMIDNKNEKKKQEEDILEVKLCDFGFTHFWREERIPKFVGTKEYLPPEIRFHSSPYLPSDFLGDKADIWSLGVVLFCMISGLFPFIYENNNIYAVNFDIITQNTKGNDCMDLLEKIFCPSPEDRPSIAQILAHPWLKNCENIQFEEKYKSKSTPALRSASRVRVQAKFQKLVYMIASQI